MPKQVTFDRLIVTALVLTSDPAIPGRVNARAEFLVLSPQGITYQGSEAIDITALGKAPADLLQAVANILAAKYTQG